MSSQLAAGDVQDALDSVDWDFASAPPSSDVHSVHPYPAKFIPQIPRKLIELFHPEDGAAVLDPFCGSGTALVEAARLGLNAVGIDLNPLACLIARVKTRPLPPRFEAAARRVEARARPLANSQSLVIPSIPGLDHWFLPDVQLALAALVLCIEEERDDRTRDALKLALSSIIVQVSNQDSDTRYAAVVKNVNAYIVFEKFERAANSVARSFISLQDNMFVRIGNVIVLNQDILTVQPNQIQLPIGLVVTSPPYPNAYEYWLYHKYRMYWLGMDPISVRKHEIGARPHYFKTNHQDEHDFERQMKITFKMLYEVTSPSAKVCFLVGRSIIHGRVIDNTALLERAADPYFVRSGIIARAIRKTRKSFNLAHGKIDREHLLVFTRR